MAKFVSGLCEEREVSDECIAALTLDDKVVRDDQGRVTSVTLNANNPKYHGFLVTWFRVPE